MIQMIATDQCSHIQVKYLTAITVNEMPELRWLYTLSQHYIGNYDPILIRSEIVEVMVSETE